MRKECEIDLVPVVWWRSERSIGGRGRRWRRGSERGGVGGVGRCLGEGASAVDLGSNGSERPISDPILSRTVAARE